VKLSDGEWREVEKLTGNASAQTVAERKPAKAPATKKLRAKLVGRVRRVTAKMKSRVRK